MSATNCEHGRVITFHCYSVDGVKINYRLYVMSSSHYDEEQEATPFLIMACFFTSNDMK